MYFIFMGKNTPVTQNGTANTSSQNSYVIWPSLSSRCKIGYSWKMEKSGGPQDHNDLALRMKSYLVPSVFSVCQENFMSIY